MIFYQELLWNIRSRLNSSTFLVFEPNSVHGISLSEVASVLLGYRFCCLLYMGHIWRRPPGASSHIFHVKVSVTYKNRYRYNFCISSKVLWSLLRIYVKKTLPKNQNNCQKNSSKNSSTKFVKKFVQKIREKSLSKNFVQKFVKKIHQKKS